MTDYVLSIDPGVSTGIALIGYEPDEPPLLAYATQFTGGVLSLTHWIEEHYDAEVPPNVTVVAEKFTARNTKGFSYKTDSLEPLRGEGALIMAGLMPDYTPKEKRWRDPGLQYLVGGKDLADKKRRQHAFLKDSGFYRTNKDFPDSPVKDHADDYRSAVAHGLAYLMREVRHRPTYDLVTEWSN